MDCLTARGKYKGLKTPRALYGGSGYSGKSYALRSATVELNGYLASIGFPGCTGALFCADYPKLMDRHGKMMQKEFAEVGRIRMSKIHGLHFQFYEPALGLVYLRNVADPSAYRGVEFDWVLVDELTEILRDDYDGIMYMLRNSKGLPFESFGAGTNPDGPGHGWVKKLWIEHDFIDEHKTMQDIEDQYIFVTAKPYDNPTFNEQRAVQLQGFADPMIVKSRWEGSWDLASGNRFARFSRNIHVFNWEEFEELYHAPAQKVLKDIDKFEIYGSFDYGTDLKSASAFYLHAVDWKGRVWTIHEEYMRGMYLEEQAEHILALISPFERNFRRIYADPSIWGRESDGMSRATKFRDLGVTMAPGINERIEGWASIDTALFYKKIPSLADPTKMIFDPAPQWRLHQSCKEVIRQLATAPRDERRMEDVSKDFRDDHGLDSVRYFIHSRHKQPNQLPQNVFHDAKAGFIKRMGYN